MNIFVIADTHFGHKNIIKYCKRPFHDAREMDEHIIDEWNSIVTSKDTIYHLGDFAMGNYGYIKSILRRLNGRKFLCIGSHDQTTKKLSKYFEGIRESFMIRVSGNQFAYLHHYLHKVWPKSHYGVWHLFGHSHGRMNSYAESEGKLLDVGADVHDFRPWSLEEIAEEMKTRPLNFNDLKRQPRR